MNKCARFIYYIIPACVGTLGLLFSVYGNFYCRTIQFVPITGSVQADGQSLFPNINLGPWYQSEIQTTQITIDGDGTTKFFVREVCVPLQGGLTIDTKWRTVRAFSIITTVLGFFMILPLWFIPCHRTFTDDTIKALGVGGFMFLLTLCQGLSLLFLSSDAACGPYTPFFRDTNSGLVDNILLRTVYSNECEWNDGTSAAVTGTVLFFLTGLLLVVIGVPSDESFVTPQTTQEVIYQREQNPDGTYTTQEVNVNIIKGTNVEAPQSSSSPTSTTHNNDADNKNADMA